MASRTPEDQAAFAGLFGQPLPAQQVPAPDYSGFAEDPAILPDFAPPQPLPEPEPELPAWEPPAYPEDAPAPARPALTIDEQLAQVRPGDAQRDAAIIEANRAARAGQAEPQSPELKSIRAGGDSARVSTSRTDSHSTQRMTEKERGDYVAPEYGDLSPAAQADIDASRKAAEAQAQAVRKDAEAQIAYQKAVAKDKRKIAIQDQADAEEEAIFNARANAEADENIQNVARAMDAVKSMKVDPSRIWTQNGEANRMTGLAAAFIGGFLQPVLGSNTIQQTLDRAIDRDIDAQKSDIAGAQRNVANLQQLHKLGLQQAENEGEQRDQDRLLRRSSLIGMLQADTEKLQDPIMRAKSNKAIADLEAANAQDLEKLRGNDFARKQKGYEFEMDQKRMRQQVLTQEATKRRGHSLAHKRGMREMDIQEAQNARKAAPVEKYEPMAQNAITGKVVGRYKRPDDTTGNRDWDGRLAKRQKLIDDMSAMREHLAIVGATYQGKGSKYFQTEAGRRMINRYKGMITDHLYDKSGAAINESEARRAEEVLEQPETLLGPSPFASWGEVVRRNIEQQEADNNVFLRDNDWDVRSEWGVAINETEDGSRGEMIDESLDIIQQSSPPVDTIDPEKHHISRMESISRAYKLGGKDQDKSLALFQHLSEKQAQVSAEALSEVANEMADAGLSPSSDYPKNSAEIAHAFKQGRIDAGTANHLNDLNEASRRQLEVQKAVHGKYRKLYQGSSTQTREGMRRVQEALPGGMRVK